MILARIRTYVYSLYLVLATGIIAVLALPTLLMPQSATTRAIRIWARVLLFGLRTICGVGYVVEGKENIPSGAAIVAANHQSMWETIALFCVLENPVVVFKKELLRVPVYGWWARRSRSIPVDRSAGAKAIRRLTQVARERLAEGRQIVLFPEGTRVPLGQRRKLQPGVAAIYLGADAPCAPAVHNSGRHWLFPGGVGGLKIPGTITLRFLPPIPPGLPRKDFTAALESALESGRDDPPAALRDEGAAHEGAAA